MNDMAFCLVNKHLFGKAGPALCSDAKERRIRGIGQNNDILYHENSK